MKKPLIPDPNFSSANKIEIIVGIIILGILLIVLGFLVGPLLRQNGFRFSRTVLRAQARLTPVVVVATEAVSTADCGSPTLILGTTIFEIQSLPREPDGLLKVPKDTLGIAYNVKGTEANPVFLLSPMPQNIGVMATISIGSAAKVTWIDCTSATYSLSAPRSGSLKDSVFAEHSTESITVFFPTVSSDEGFVFTGKRIQEP